MMNTSLDYGMVFDREYRLIYPLNIIAEKYYDKGSNIKMTSLYSQFICAYFVLVYLCKHSIYLFLYNLS